MSKSANKENIVVKLINVYFWKRAELIIYGSLAPDFEGLGYH